MNNGNNRAPVILAFSIGIAVGYAGLWAILAFLQPDGCW